MLRASKLCQSVSTSGPSAIWKPSPTKTSSRRSHAWVTMWAWPRRGRARISVRSSRSASTRRRARRPPARSRRVASGGAGLLVGLVEGLAGGLLLVHRGERAELRLQLGEVAALAEQLASSSAATSSSVVRRGCVRAPPPWRHGCRRSTGVLSGSASGCDPGRTRAAARQQVALTDPGVRPGHRNRRPHTATLERAAKTARGAGHRHNGLRPLRSRADQWRGRPGRHRIDGLSRVRFGAAARWSKRLWKWVVGSPCDRVRFGAAAWLLPSVVVGSGGGHAAGVKRSATRARAAINASCPSGSSGSSGVVGVRPVGATSMLEPW